ncbi:DNA polymerase III subunit gamma and tau [Pseudonocardia petroleophila]|uniref:DNA polymerase III subunit gamma/tau n=1 Tax=Pseudonocardia petroleophila TaxID=37331 RepID=A0A7G7MLI2_9PSEU|nr:DNA polymerase III subunit gamma and tau [Pseudonocardia petroleophila]QNG53643.1 DNA polymerase III subunit gamma and tau [Pseudonocardia petroleophila]
MALALYRKYRPATFAEVVGQEHVTEPLSTALAAGRINHAYLFSGPRGCGKTSSARILARSLNCEQGPTPDPCGVCASCIALAPGGPGNIDVTELDAASHGGVDDTRELRDRAFFAPAESRYRVFIVDEAHMITTQGFNALLKIVEEPPEHLVFVFATTEPDKVLPTIRSRTHHYPFRLIPPGTLRRLMEGICADEGAVVAPAVYPLVIRAGGGSARDSLSVLDQLLAGAGPEGVTYERAVALLGVTDVALIDDMVDALAAGDRSVVFETVDRLVEAGHDPRRFASDLLQRLRDITLLQAVPDAAERGLVEAAADEVARIVEQADRIGPATLARYGEIVHTGLTEMRGATAPRLLLELLCARMLLPAASTAEPGMLERLERLERRSDIAATSGVEHPVADGGGSASGRTFRRASEAAPADAAPAASRPAATPPAAAPPAAREPASAEPVPPPVAASPAGAPPAAPGSATGAAGTGAADPAERGPARTAAPRGAADARPDSTRPDAARSGSARPDPARPDPARPGAGPARGADDGSPDRQAPEGRPVADRTGSAGSGHGAAAAGPAAAPPPAPDDRTADTRDGRPSAPAAAAPAGEPAEPDRPTAPARPASGLDAAAVRRVWPEILSAAKERKKRTAALLVSATVRAVENDTLVLSIGTAPLARLLSEQSNTDVIAESLHAVLGVSWRVRCEHGDGGTPAGSAPRGSGPTPPAAAPAPPRRPPPTRRSTAPDDGTPLPPEPPPEDAPPDDEESMIAEAAAAPVTSHAERRDPEEAAIELLTTQLGARALDQH